MKILQKLRVLTRPLVWWKPPLLDENASAAADEMAAEIKRLREKWKAGSVEAGLDGKSYSCGSGIRGHPSGVKWRVDIGFDGRCAVRIGGNKEIASQIKRLFRYANKDRIRYLIADLYDNLPTP